MKKISLAFLGLLFTMSVMAQKKPFEIKGQLSKGKTGTVLLNYRGPNGKGSYTSKVEDGKFEFKDEIIFPTAVWLNYVGPEGSPTGGVSMEYIWAQDEREIYIDGSKITITGDSLKTATISGAGKAQNENEILQKSMKPWLAKHRVIERAYAKAQRAKDQPEIDKQDIAMHKSFDVLEAAENEFIKAHPDSHVCLNLLEARKNKNRTASIKPMFELLTPDLKNSLIGQSIIQNLVKLAVVEIGKPAVDFTQNDVNGNPITLSSLKGKYVLVDFWASWCAPCRAENPNVLKVYNQYKDKGFEVLGVSLDDKKDNWVNAIKADGLPWLQVSDLKGWKNVVALQYNIRAVPANILVDPNGVIIARDLTGPALEKKFEEIFADEPVRGRG